jgi:hypothetical protein
VVTRIDFSDDSLVLQSTDGAREVLYWEIPSCKQLSYSKVKDLSWSSWSNALGLCVKVS